MVARPKSPDGRSVTRAVKLSEAEAAAADAIRGEVRWSEWLRALVLAAARGDEPVRVSPVVLGEAVNRNEPVNLNGDGKPVNRNVAVNQNEAPKRARAAKVPPVLAAAGLVPASSLPARRRCTHQGTRVIGGYCRECDHRIEPGGLWAC